MRSSGTSRNCARALLRYNELSAVKGAKQVRAGPHGNSTLFVFVMPPSMEELEHRLRGRGTEAEEKIQRRLANAHKELAAAEDPGFVSKVIVNKDLDTAVAELEAAVAAHLPELNITPSAPSVAPPAAAVGSTGASKTHDCTFYERPAVCDAGAAFTS